MMTSILTAQIYRTVLRPLLFALDAETAHHVAMGMLSTAARTRFPLPLLRKIAGTPPVSDPKLARTVFGVHFPNPVGLAAGFDKNGVALAAWEALGFGFVEVGTITARAQPGNPPPRLFRVPEQRGLINRLGFNNDGADAVAERFIYLRTQGKWPNVPVGINIGKSKLTPLEHAAEDYVATFSKLHDFGDYFVLNVSSPNTPGLRALQGRRELDALLETVQLKNRSLTRQRPILVKIAPDLSCAQIEEIVELAITHGLAGIVATNTTTDHRALLGTISRDAGGLSGEPLRSRSTAVVRFLSERTSLPIIAVGGVSDGPSVQEKIDAGAALVQIYTGFVYSGPTLLQEIRRDLRNRHSYNSVDSI